MKVTLSGISKKFGREWIFREIDYVFDSNSTTALTGKNGSGKSTLIQIISSFSDPTLGKITYSHNPPQQHIGFVAPYLELIEELTLWEHLKFHFQFRESTCHFDEMLESSGLKSAKNKYVSDFSSGMKQRLKLLLAFYAKNSLLLLDEPCSNLDEHGVQWYHQMVSRVLNQRTIIIASNQRFEYEICDHILELNNYKPKSKRPS